MEITADMKRPAAEFDQLPSNELEKVYPNEDTISSLLTELEAYFQHRENTKEQAFTKWEQEGTHTSLFILNELSNYSLRNLFIIYLPYC